MNLPIGTRVTITFSGIVTSNDEMDEVCEVKSEDGYRQVVNLNYPLLTIMKDES